MDKLYKIIGILNNKTYEKDNLFSKQKVRVNPLKVSSRLQKHYPK